MPLLPVSVAPRIAPSASSGASSLALVVGLSVVALVAVVAGFAMVAAALLGWSAVSPVWGLLLAGGGLALATVARDRAPRLRR